MLQKLKEYDPSRQAHILSGTGNCFALFDLRVTTDLENWRNQFGIDFSDWAPKICSNSSLKLDGLLILTQEIEDQVVQWHYYNKDGSEPGMCGNGARCAGAYLLEKDSNSSRTEFCIRDLHIESWKEGGNYFVKMPPPKVIQRDFDPEVEGLKKGWLVDTGVPHWVFAVSEKYDRDKDKWNKKKLLEFVISLRHHKEAGPDGANVSFFEVLSENLIATISFERGVEDYTEACGTGAMASGFVFKLNDSNEDIVKVKMPGGLLTTSNKGQWALGGEVEFIKNLELVK